MNERIKDLIKTKSNILFPGTDTVDCEISDIEKFAELIIEECLLCCERTISDPVPKSVDTFEQGGIHCIGEIKKHFGVGMTTEDKKTLIKGLLGLNNV